MAANFAVAQDPAEAVKEVLDHSAANTARMARPASRQTCAVRPFRSTTLKPISDRSR